MGNYSSWSFFDKFLSKFYPCVLKKTWVNKTSIFTILENSSLFVNIKTLYLLYFIMSLLSRSKLAEQVAREMALIMLESPHGDE